MDFKVKRWLTYLTIGFMFVSSGVEYAVVFPTIWTYLKKLGAKNESLLGLAIGAFSLPSILIGPVIGKLFDKFHNAKAILITVNMFEIFGSIMYLMALGPWFIIASRFVSGIGSCGAAIVFADISNSTPVEERTRIITIFQACTQIGLLIGPGFNLLLRKFNFKIGRFVVDKFTAPGLFMAVVGIISEILFMTTYFNLGTLYNKQRIIESLQHSYANESLDRGAVGENVEGFRSYHSINSDTDPDHIDGGIACSMHNSISNTVVILHEGDAQTLANGDTLVSPQHLTRRLLQRPMSPSSDEMIEDAENFMYGIGELWEQASNSRPCSQISKCTDSHNPDFTIDTVSTSNADDKIRSTSSTIDSEYCQSQVISLQWSQIFKPYKDEFLRDEVIVLLGVSFVAYFAQTSLETIATPLTQSVYNFDDFANSLFFLVCGIEILLSFMLIRLLSRKIEDRVLILIGSTSMIFSLSWYLVVIPNITHGDWSTLPYFVIGIFTNLLGISFLVACCISLYSKLISKSNQGVAHGIRRTVLSVGMILGPIWGGSSLHIPIVLFSVPLAMISCFTVLFLLSYKRLRVDKQCGEDHIKVHRGSRRYSSRLKGNSTDDESSPLLSGTQ